MTKAPNQRATRHRLSPFRMGQWLQGLVMGPLFFAALAALFAIASDVPAFRYQGY